MNTHPVRTQPNPRLIPGGDKRFPFPPGWVHPIEGPHSGMHAMTTRKPKPPPATSASRDWGQLFKLHDRIKPPEGWRPVAAEGFRIAEMADRVDLVRLRDVADWLALNEKRDEVLRRCLGRLVDADLYPLCMFYVLDPDGEPVRVLDRFQASMAAATALGLPGVYPTSEPVEVAAWLLDAWWRVWPGHSDISHLVDRAEIIQRRHEKGRRFRLQALGLTESDVEDEPAYWPADDVLLASLNRLALPVFVAFDLWGYGVDTAAPAAGVEVAAATSASNVVPLREKATAVDAVGKPDATMQSAGEVANPVEAADDEPAWLTAKNYNVAWLLSERDRFKKLHGERGHYMKKLVAQLKALGVDVPGKDPAREIRRLEDAATGKKEKKEAATFVSGLGGRKSGGTC